MKIMITWKVSNAVFIKILRSHIQAPRNRAGERWATPACTGCWKGWHLCVWAPAAKALKTRGRAQVLPVSRLISPFASRDPQLSLWRWRARPSGVHTRAGPWGGSECCSSQHYSDSRVWRLWFHQDSHLYGKTGEKGVFNEVQSS